MFEKIWEAHEVSEGLIYIDLHLVHEVTSPQAFDGLRLAERKVRRPDRTLATADHNVPTDGTPSAREDRRRPLAKAGRKARGELRGVRRAGLLARLRLPGHRPRDRPRAGRDAAGHDDRLRRFATPRPTARSARSRSASAPRRSSTSSRRRRSCRSARRRCASPTRASSANGVAAKDLILATIGKLGTGGMVGHAVEYAGETMAGLSMENRMTICNMTIEGGGRAGMIAPGRDDLRVDRGPARGARGLRRGGRRVARASDRGRRRVRHRGRGERRRDLAHGHVGHEPGPGRPGHGLRSRADRRNRGARPRLHGPRARHGDAGDPARAHLHRLVHELADRRPARGRVDGRGPQGRLDARGDGRPRLGAGEGAGRGGGPRRGLPRRRLRLALGGLLDVPGDEPGHPQPRASAAPRRRTATSRAARARAGAPTS